MNRDRWQPKVDALLRLAQDKGATPAERETAREKLAQILREHPQAQEIRQYEPVRRFTMDDLAFMKQHDISTDGSWTGGNLSEALQLMVADYAGRIGQHRPLRALAQPGVEDCMAPVPPVMVPRPLPRWVRIAADEVKAAIDRQLEAEIEELERLLEE